MKKKIAIITTEFLETFVRSSFQELYPDLEIELFIYHTYRDIETLYRTIPSEYEGVLTSGIFPAAIILKCFPDTSRCIGYFNTDDAAICRLFLKLFIQEGGLDLSRVYGDFVEVFGMDLEDYLTKNQKASYTELVDPKVLHMTTEEICLLEERQLKRHLELHREGKVDFSVTRFSSIVPAIMDQGFKVYFPFPSKDYMKSTTDQLLQAIAMRHMEDNRPAVINVSIQPEDNSLPGATSFQLRCNILQEALLEFQGSSLLDYIIQPTNTGFEILTNKKKLAHDTDQFTSCTLTAFLKRKLNFTVCIGYGIGKDMYQARMNAIHAEREASLRKPGSFLINEKEELIGPLGETELSRASAYFPVDMEAVVKNSGLSPVTVSRVFQAFLSMPEHQLTAGDLANKLAITKRSANRFLSALLKAEMIRIKTQKRPTTKGRPERVYEIVM